MISYKNCSEVAFAQIYDCFRIGFSDYMIKLDISIEDFRKRFFGPEGNSFEHSFVAFDGERPIGIILGGIKTYEGLRTMRCGTLCIDPEYRGRGVSQELFRLHKEMALLNACKQMFLEVITNNDRAVRFYKRLGYSKIYDLGYYSHPAADALKEKCQFTSEVRRVNLELLRNLKKDIQDVHINWQNDFDYMEKLEGLLCYCTYLNSEVVSAICISPMGKIFFIWTKPELRNKGAALNLLCKVVRENGLKKLSISFPNNSSLHGFVQHMGFTKDEISQYEMYLTL